MKLFNIVSRSNDEIVFLKNSFWADTLKLKSIYFMSSQDVNEDVMQVSIEFLNETINVHTTLNADHPVLPLNTKAGERKSKKTYDVLFREVNIPQQFRVRALDVNGDPFNPALFGTLVITLEADSDL